MNSISGFSKILSKFYAIRYGLFDFLENCYGLFDFLENNFWWLLLYVLEAPVFQKTSKWILSNRASFFSEYSSLKNHPKKHVPSFLFPWYEGIPSLLFIIIFYAITLQKLFFTDKTSTPKIATPEYYPLTHGENLLGAVFRGAIFWSRTKHKGFNFFKATHFQH